MLHALLELVSASPWTYGVLASVAALDVVLPVLPSEAAVISAGILASAGELSIALVIAAGAAGAIAGDTAAYSAGRLLGPRLERRLKRYPSFERRRSWAEGALRTRGGLLLFAARFIPFGSAVTVTNFDYPETVSF